MVSKFSAETFTPIRTLADLREILEITEYTDSRCPIFLQINEETGEQSLVISGRIA